MPRIKVTTVFKFDELSDKAKEKARDWYREGGLGYDWWGTVYDDAVQVGELIGIDIDVREGGGPSIYFTGFYHQGSGASFRGRYAYKKGWREALAEYAPKTEGNDELWSIAERLQVAQAKQFYKLVADVLPSGDSSVTVSVSHEDSLYRDIGDAEGEIVDLMRAFADWIYQNLKRDYEFLTSDETVDEALVANEYEFTEEGEPA